MPSSPITPRHSRHPSSITFDFNDTHSHAPSSMASSPNHERRQSRSSTQEPSTPSRSTFGGGGGGGGAAHDNGLGNLADELADAFSDDLEDDDADEDGYGYYDEEAGEGPPDIQVENGVDGEHMKSAEGGARDSGIEVGSSPAAADGAAGGGNGHKRDAQKDSLSLPSPNGARGHRRIGSEYDGSEYGSESDLDSPGMSAGLVAKMDAVESLARRGTESNGSAADGAVKRVTEELRDLGSQAGVEGGAQRLITAHSALTSHLAHQTRQIHNLTFPLLSPLVQPPDPDTIDELLPMLVSLSDSMPRPSTSAYTSLAALHTLTADLCQTLNYLSDTLHMSRQTTTTATRRLKSAKELVGEMKREEELREEGERWLTRGNWSERLQNRECALVCGEVVGGFEAVCDSWRARLLASAGEAQA